MALNPNITNPNVKSRKAVNFQTIKHGVIMIKTSDGSIIEIKPVVNRAFKMEYITLPPKGKPQPPPFDLEIGMTIVIHNPTEALELELDKKKYDGT